MAGRKIILDCDPGHDDAIALFMAAAHPAIDLLGVTIVAGNQTLAKTVRNGLNVAQLLDIDTKIYAGMPQPMVRQQVVAGNIHGETGLDGPTFGPLHREAEKQNAVDFIIDTLMASDGDITLVPTAPLTNIAVAMRREPRIIPKIQEIVLMGGAYGTGNFTPSAEFNIFADPEAAKVVFGAGVPITMMGLDLTEQTICTPDIIKRMEDVGNTAGKLFSDMMNFTLKTQFEAFGLKAGPVHDATTIGYLIEPDIFKTESVYVDVDIDRGPCYGRTVCDMHHVMKEEPNTKVGIALDLDKFWDLVEECVRMYK
ncbi:ribosylpyrimidine nucleosidase [Furfurilactobacillus milii]|uniref:Ribosylpyrimidine nucleosidase n=1 Tax=Furfurilactobacillus milii TaxID=2888272 RepID=A0A6N9I3T0_9LACO|nr:ribosylpyrimidine nucleosidase [Furfurilactobacillus milii]MYV17625.1 ribosylpyrimidine nucleosidase [Furfurilactobacillus milii]